MDTVIGTERYKKGLNFKELFVEENNGCQQVIDCIDENNSWGCGMAVCGHYIDD